MGRTKALKKEFEDEYELLKREEEIDELKKTTILIIICAITIIVTIISATFSAYSSKVKSATNGQVLVEAKNQFITINYLSGDKIEIDKENKFTIHNNSDIKAKYKIEWVNITNENLNNLVFILKRDNEVMINNQIVPSTNTSIIDGLEIEAGETITFEILVSKKNIEEELKNYKAEIKVTIIN